MSSSLPTLGSLLSTVSICGRNFTLDLNTPSLDLCTAVRPLSDPATVPSAFGLPKPTAEPTRVKDWVASMEQGSSVNVNTISLCVHGSCTHTECVGHVAKGGVTLGDLEPVPPFVPGLVLNVAPERLGRTDETYGSPKAQASDFVVTAHALKDAIRRAVASAGSDPIILPEDDQAFAEAVVVNVASGSATKQAVGTDYTGTNPPYFTTEAITFLCNTLGMRHLLVNLPSVDREDDGGLVLNHRAVFRCGLRTPRRKTGAKALPCYTITELCNIPPNATEGRVLVSLQVSPIELEAAPSRPLVYYLAAVEAGTSSAAGAGKGTVDVAALRARYEAVGQGHVFEYYEQLSPEEQQVLVEQLTTINPEQVLDQYMRTSAVSKEEMSSGIENCRPTCLDVSSEGDKQKWADTAMEAIGNGQVGVIVLAGGQGTRLGFPKPKGCFPGTDPEVMAAWIPSGKPLFRLQAERIRALESKAKAAGGTNAVIQWYIMTSPMTHEACLEELQSNAYFGLDSAQVHLFQQGTLPCISDAGTKFILNSRSELASAPDGNGGIYKALHTYGGNGGMIADMENNGVKYLFAYAVDNCICKIADPLYMGFCIGNGVKAGNKVTEKREPHEKVGLQCIRNGRYEVVEYSDIDPKLCEQRDENGKLKMSSGSVCIHYYSVDFLKTECHPDNLSSALDFHVAHKAIPSWDDATGTAVKPPAPNGVKLETFIFDVFKLAGQSFGVFEVQREEEFAPIKNKSGVGVNDSPVTSAIQMSEAQKKWLLAAGAKLLNAGDKACDVEVSPLVSYAGEGLRELVEGRELQCPVAIMEKGFVPLPGSRLHGGQVTSLGPDAVAITAKSKIQLPK